MGFSISSLLRCHTLLITPGCDWIQHFGPLPALCEAAGQAGAKGAEGLGSLEARPGRIDAACR